MRSVGRGDKYLAAKLRTRFDELSRICDEAGCLLSVRDGARLRIKCATHASIAPAVEPAMSEWTGFSLLLDMLMAVKSDPREVRPTLARHGLNAAHAERERSVLIIFTQVPPCLSFSSQRLPTTTTDHHERDRLQDSPCEAREDSRILRPGGREGGA